MGIADYMWDHAHGYCDIKGHYYDDRRYYPNGRFGQPAKDEGGEQEPPKEQEQEK